MRLIGPLALLLSMTFAATLPQERASALSLDAAPTPDGIGCPAAQGIGPESQRVPIACGFSVCFPMESRPLKHRDGAGLECKTAEGAYYAYLFTPLEGGLLPASRSGANGTLVVSEGQLKAVSNAMLNTQIALLGQAKDKVILREEPIRVGVYYGRRVTYRTQADYGNALVNAHTVIVALAPQGKICQFTFVPAALFAAQAEALANTFFNTIRPAMRPCDGTR